jgi:hypothetical protein
MLKSALSVTFLMAALGQMAVGAVSLNLPDTTATAGTTFTFDAILDISPATTLQSMGYQIALSVSGPDNKLTITDATALGVYGTKGSLAYYPADSIDVGIPQRDIYAFTGLALSNTVSLNNGAVFATFSAQVDSGATGVYHLNWYTVDDGVFQSQVLDGTGNPMVVTFGNGSVAVPEPIFFSMVGVVSGGLLLRRRTAEAEL